MIEAKLKGEGIETGAAAEPDRGNVVDLVAALKKSLAQAEPKAEAETAPATTPPAKQKRAAGQIAKANPHPKRSLAWLSWTVARLGGRNCYYKPP